MKITPTGLDAGNSSFIVSINGKAAKVPAAYAIVRPLGQIKNGKETAPKSFSLVIDNKTLWFGADVLTSPAFRGLDEDKLDPKHLSILFRAVLYEWSRRHKIKLSTLGKLNVVCSMPPSPFANRKANAKAMAAYKATFNRRQSHMWVRDGSKVKAQIVTQFGGLEREAATYAIQQQQQAKTPVSMVADLGYGTSDYVVMEGPEIRVTKSWPTGMLHTFERMNPGNPYQAEAEILRDKTSMPPDLALYYSERREEITRIKRVIPREIRKITIIGGGAARMTPDIKSIFRGLADQVLFGNEYANALANEVRAAL